MNNTAFNQGSSDYTHHQQLKTSLQRIDKHLSQLLTAAEGLEYSARLDCNSDRDPLQGAMANHIKALRNDIAKELAPICKALDVAPILY